MSIGLFDWAVYTKMELDESLRGASRSWSISPPPLDPKSLEGGPESELAGGLRCHLPGPSFGVSCLEVLRFDVFHSRVDQLPEIVGNKWISPPVSRGKLLIPFSSFHS